MTSTLYTFGYAVPGAEDRLATLMADPSVILVDIRFSPATPTSLYRSAFRQPALKSAYGDRYDHVPELGDVNYAHRDEPIVLADRASGLGSVLFWLQSGYHVCLLCVCSRVHSCHRLVVANLVCDRFPCEVVHL